MWKSASPKFKKIQLSNARLNIFERLNSLEQSESEANLVVLVLIEDVHLQHLNNVTILGGLEVIHELYRLWLALCL